MADAQIADRPQPAAPVKLTPTAPLLKRAQAERIKLAENARQYWHVRVPEEHTPDDCLEPGYLWHRHEQMRVGDHVELFSEVGQFWMELLVARIDKQTQSIQMRILHAKDWTTEELPPVDLSGAAVEKVNADNWRVTNRQQILSSGHKTRGEAQGWLDEQKARLEPSKR